MMLTPINPDSNKTWKAPIDDPVFVILLEHNAERSAHVHKTLVQSKVNAEIFPAVDVSRVSQPEVDGYIANGDVTVNYRNELTPGELGCGMSHLLLWREIVRRKLPRALVLEDDFLFCRDFFTKYQNLKDNAPADFDIIFLYQWQRKRYPVNQLRPFENIGIPSDPYGTVGYLVSQKGAEKLSRLIPPIQGGIDGEINELFQRQQLKVFSSMENIIGDFNDFTSIVRTATFDQLSHENNNTIIH